MQQAAIGAAGSGLWAGVEAIVRSALSRKPAKREEGMGRPEQRQTLTVVIPTRPGPALAAAASLALD